MDANTKIAEGTTAASGARANPPTRNRRLNRRFPSLFIPLRTDWIIVESVNRARHVSAKTTLSGSLTENVRIPTPKDREHMIRSILQLSENGLGKRLPMW